MKQYNNSLNTLTYFDNVFYPENDEELIKIIKELKNKSKKFITVGNSTNTLFCKDISKLTLISLSKKSQFCKLNEETVSVSSNYSTIKLAFEMKKMGFNNLNFMSGIPGTVGGNVVMNAGCYGYEICDHIIDITILDENQNIIVIPRNEINFGYRYSSLLNRDIVVLSARIKLTTDEVHDITFLKKRRQDTQPIGSRTLGSIFMNPYIYRAWELLDGVRLRGFRIGNTRISEKHPNFIISEDGSTAEEYAALIELARRMVYLKYRIRLSREVMIYE